MDILSELISSLGTNEVKHFKIFASRAGLDDRKDLKLFDYIRKTDSNYNENKIFEELYSSLDKNAFYRLKNRLAEDIAKSLLIQSYRDSAYTHAMFLTGVSHYFFNTGKYRLCYTYLKKAEKKAECTENPSLLDFIYSLMIKVSREITNLNPEKYIIKRRNNRELLNKVSELEDILEAIEYRMKVTQNYVKSSEELLQILQGTVKEFTSNENLLKSPKLQIDLYLLISRILLQKKDYNALEDYLERTYTEFNTNGIFNKLNHHYKLQMLSWLANASFKNKKYHKSLQFGEILKVEMKKNERSLYDKYALFYYNLLIGNTLAINPTKAIKLLEGLVKQKDLISKPYYGLFIYLNLAIVYYQDKNLSKAIHAINQLYFHDGYKTTDDIVKIKIQLGELMIRYDLGDLDIAKYRSNQIDKEYGHLLTNSELLLKEFEFHNIFKDLLDNKYDGVRDRSFIIRVRNYLEKYKLDLQEDDSFFHYDSWFKEKTGITI